MTLNLLETANGRLASDDRRLSTVYLELTTDNCLLPTENLHIAPRI